jgi:nitroreductase
MELLEGIQSRTSPLKLTSPGPTETHLQQILRAGTRAPDHGRLRPWRFLVIEGGQREKLADILVASAKRRCPGLPESDLQRERGKALRAPMIIVVACRIVKGTKIPDIEQILAAGAATQNILLAFHGLGYSAAWKTGEAAYDPEVKTALGLAADDHIVGLVYTGGGEGATFAPGKPASVEDAMLKFPDA